MRSLHVGLLVAAVVGCGPSRGADAAVPPDAYSTGSVCPPASTLTYESFAAPFFATYCVRCHATSNVTVESRSGAPDDVNFDDAALVRALVRRIDRMAAIGPLRENRLMPPEGTAPSDEDRRRLGEWIACGAP
jgi:uncharacterized membrane protein